MRFFAVLAVVSLMVAIPLLSFPAQKSDPNNVVDFSFSYCAGQIVRQGLGRDLYDLKTQVQFQSKVAFVHAFYNHPPYEALLYVPLTYFSYHTAYTVWTFVSLAFLFSAVFLIGSHTKVSLAISQYVRMPGDLGLLLVICITFAPVTTCLLLGQNSMLTLLIYTLVFVLLKQDLPTIAGGVLALGLYKFQLILPLVVILLLCRKWPAIRGFSAVAFVMALLSVGISGFRVIINYPKFLLFDSVYQKVAGFNPGYMPNIRGILYLTIGGRVGKPIFGLLVTVSSALVLWIASRNWRDEELGLSFSTALLATLLASYHLYNYDLTLLLLPMAIICSELAMRGRLLRATILNMALIALFVSPLHRFLLLYSIYPLMCVPIVILLVNAIRLSQDIRLVSGRVVVATAQA